MIDDILNLFVAAFIMLLSARILGADVSVPWIFAPVVALISTCAIVDVLGAIMARKVERENEEEKAEKGKDTDDNSKGTA